MNRIEARSLSFSWGETPILHNISLSVQEGSFVGFIGPNGSGKSTFLKCIYRVLKHNTGCVYLDGKDTQKRA